jgi:hypothetical protein
MSKVHEFDLEGLYHTDPKRDNFRLETLVSFIIIFDTQDDQSRDFGLQLHTEKLRVENSLGNEERYERA